MTTRHILLLSPLATLLLPCALLFAEGDEKPAATVEVKIKDLTMNVPKAWKKQDPSSRLRLAQFVLPAVEGDKEPGELVVFSFGVSQVEANIKRWISQFRAEERTVKITRGDAEQGQYIFVELTGTYMKPIGPPIARKTVDAPGYRVLAVILVVHNKGVYYLKAVGPDKTVAANKKALRQSFGGKAATEKEFKL